MKALRGIKKRKIITLQDPEKLAQQKLAILSDQAFIQETFQRKNSQFWTINSSNILPSSNKNIFLNEQTDRNDKKIKQKMYTSFYSHNKNILSQQADKQSLIRKYMEQKDEQKVRGNKNLDLFPEKKSLSLTNYILFDKRKFNFTSQKTTPNRPEQSRLRILQIKKVLSNKKNKKYQTPEKLSHSVQKKPTKQNDNSFLNRSEHLSEQKVRENRSIQKFKVRNWKEKTGSEADRILSGIIKRKQVPLINTKQFHREYLLLKEKNEQSSFMSSAINSTKVQLHQYYKKFIYWNEG